MLVSIAVIVATRDIMGVIAMMKTMLISIELVIELLSAVRS